MGLFVFLSFVWMSQFIFQCDYWIPGQAKKSTKPFRHGDVPKTAGASLARSRIFTVLDLSDLLNILGGQHREQLRSVFWLCLQVSS